jgi:hypothetical protein
VRGISDGGVVCCLRGCMSDGEVTSGVNGPTEKEAPVGYPPTDLKQRRQVGSSLGVKVALQRAVYSP